jgi:hypothetical protein
VGLFCCDPIRVVDSAVCTPHCRSSSRDASLTVDKSNRTLHHGAAALQSRVGVAVVIDRDTPPWTGPTGLPIWPISKRGRSLYGERDPKNCPAADYGTDRTRVPTRGSGPAATTATEAAPSSISARAGRIRTRPHHCSHSAAPSTRSSSTRPSVLSSSSSSAGNVAVSTRRGRYRPSGARSECHWGPAACYPAAFLTRHLQASEP